MSEVVLVVLGRADRVSDLLTAAQRLATLLGGAHINVLAVRSPFLDGLLLGGPMTEEAAALLAAGQARIASLKASFETWAGNACIGEISARWIEAEGAPASLVEERGRRADIIVVSRPESSDGRSARQAFRAALFETERPVLMVPENRPALFGQRVAIAWRDDERAVKAMIPALRFLGRAREVHLLAGYRPGRPRPEAPRILIEHGIRADLHIMPIGPGPFGQALLETAHALYADMLVMGAYAHSPLRELILGGVTRYMLTHADLPVFMRH
jgi:nucleotide-binding universal stress UspA family protein